MAESTTLSVMGTFREEMAPVRNEAAMVLPSHITPDKFMQVCITAVENSPALLSADRQSFKIACLNAANDGLLPDKREGAFVIFNTEVEVRREGSNATYKEKRALVQWMPMAFGILKKAYNTGKVSSIAVELVHKNDVYRRAAGDNAEIVHEPLDFGDRGPVVGGYVIIHMKDGGEPYREVASLADIEKVRNVSRSKDRGPWVQFWDEMAKKTIIRRALKRVPLSAEVDQVLARDDVFYNMTHDGLSRVDVPLVPSVPRHRLASGRAHIKRERIAAPDEPNEPVADEPATGTAAVGDVDTGQPAGAMEEAEAPEHSEAVAAVVSAIRSAGSPSELAEAIHLASTTQQTDAEAEWVKDEADRRTADLLPPHEFKLQALISSVTGLRDYEDVRLWETDILEKLSAAKQPALGAFWGKNLEFVLEAGENGHAIQAERILQVARSKGLSTEHE